MVLKLLIFLIFISPLHSYSDEGLDYLLRLGHYEEVVSEIEDIEDDRDLSYGTNQRLYEFKALALERSGDVDGAIEVYKSLLKVNFGDINQKLMKAAIKLKRVRLKVENRELLEFYYRKLAELYIGQFLKVNRGTDRNVVKKTRYNAVIFTRMYSLVGNDTEGAQALIEQIKGHHNYLNSYKFKTNYYAYLSVISFQDNLILRKNDNSSEAKVLNTTIGSCSGLGKRWKNDYNEINLQFCYLSAKSSVYTSGGSLIYQADSVPVSGIHGAVDYLISPASTSTAYGASLDILSRTGDWVDPADAAFEEKSYTRFGISLKTKWNIKKYSLVLSMGRIFKNVSTLFLLSSQYNF